MSGDIIAQFRAAMAEAGIAYEGEIIADGMRHRFRSEGDRRDNVIYQLWDDDHPAGWFKDFKRDAYVTWSDKNGVELSEAERRAWRERQAEFRREREAAEKEYHAEARARAAAKWEAAKPETGEHRYLRAKHVGGYGLRSNGYLLYVPLRDTEGALHGLQYISPNGDKRFLTGTVVAGHYHAIGPIKDRILIAEGYATAATLRDCTGEAVAVAFNAGNLKPVAVALRGKYPHIAIVICADDDQWTEGNPGLTKAREAALAVGGKLAVPRFEDISDNPTDFNDLAQMDGAEAVPRCIQEAKETDKPKARGIVTVDLTEFLATELPPREAILLPWLLKQALAMIYAWRGVGKTYVALWIAYMVAAGGEVLGWKATTARKVLYVDGEMPAKALQERLARIVKSTDLEPAPGMLRLITPDLQHACIPDLATRQGQRAIEAVMGKDTELLILDNLSCLVRRGGRENEAESWLSVAEWTLSLRARGVSVLFIHHSGKDGAINGVPRSGRTN